MHKVEILSVWYVIRIDCQLYWIEIVHQPDKIATINFNHFWSHDRLTSPHYKFSCRVTDCEAKLKTNPKQNGISIVAKWNDKLNAKIKKIGLFWLSYDCVNIPLVENWYHSVCVVASCEQFWWQFILTFFRIWSVFRINSHETYVCVCLCLIFLFLLLLC